MRGSRVGACAKPSCSCSVWTTTIQTHESPPRLRSRPTSATSRPSSRSSQRRGTSARQQRTGAEPSTSHVSRGSSRQRKDSHHHNGRRCVGGRAIVWGSWGAETARSLAICIDHFAGPPKDGQERFRHPRAEHRVRKGRARVCMMEECTSLADLSTGCLSSDLEQGHHFGRRGMRSALGGQASVVALCFHTLSTDQDVRTKFSQIQKIPKHSKHEKIKTRKK